MTLGNHFLCSYLVHHLELFSPNVLKLKTTPAGSKCSRQRSTFWRPLQRERATVDIRTWSRHTVWIWVEIHFRTELMIFCNFLIANIEIGQPSKSTLGGSWKWCSERTRPSCPRRGKDNCGFQSRIKIFSTFSKNFWKINLQIFVRFARKDVFSFDCDIFGQHVAGGNIYLCPRALILLN